MTGSRWRQARTPVLVAAGVGVATLALRLRDPHQDGSWGLCPFKAVTGWDCPGCGGLRAVNDLTHFRFADAWYSNALFIAAVPALVGLWVLWTVRAWSGSGRSLPPEVVRYGGIAFALVALAFTVWRNTPSGSAYFAA